MAVELYETIDELICGEEKAGRNPADYCFDEAWLIWLNDRFGLQDIAPRGFRNKYLALAEMLKTPEYSSETVDDYYFRVACAATEIGERLEKCKEEPAIARLDTRLSKEPNNIFRKYSADAGPIQKDMYRLLLRRNSRTEECQKCTDHCAVYSMDMMTNFYYSIKIIIGLLAPTIFNKKRSDVALNQSPFGGPRNESNEQAYRLATCFSAIYGAYQKTINIIRLEVAGSTLRAFQREINAFSKSASMLGNYHCIANKIAGLTSVNKAKGGSLSIEDGTYVNDQFAIFAQWIKEKCNNQLDSNDAELGMISDWKKDMLHDEKSLDYNNDAVLAYKAAFRCRTSEGRIEQLTAYLRDVNAAIEHRSRLILEKLEPEQAEETA